MKRFNNKELIYFLILCSVEGFFLYILSDNRYALYCNDKSRVMIYFAVVMAAVMMIIQFADIFTPKTSENILSKIIPFTLAAFIIVISINSVQYYDHNELINTSINSSKHEHNNENIHGDIRIDDENIESLLMLYKSPESYKGRNIIIKGNICRHNIEKNDLFVLRKTHYHCCIDDSVNFGIYACFSDCTNLIENDEVELNGVLDTVFIETNNDKIKIPIIIVKSIKLNTEVWCGEGAGIKSTNLMLDHIENAL